MRRLITHLALLAFAVLALAAPAHAATPMIRGWAWVDQNCDGIRQDGEPSAYSLFSIYLYRFGPDGQAFTGDDKMLRPLPAGPNAEQYEDITDSAIMLPELYRLSIVQGGRPAGYLPTKYRVGDDPARWSSLQGNWTTGDLTNRGFQLDPNGTVSGGNIGIAPQSCTAEWYTQHVHLPLVLR